MNTKKMFELSKTLQELANKYGYEDFRDAITQTCFDIVANHAHSNILRRKYKDLGNAVCDFAIQQNTTEKEE